MKTNPLFFLGLFLLMILNSCSEDESFESTPFVVAFENPSLNITEISDEQLISLVYSKASESSGTILIKVTSDGAIEGADFSITPALDNGYLTVNISQNTLATDFVFTKLNPNLSEANIVFEIENIEYDEALIQGYSVLEMNAEASQGGVILPEVGGPNQGNQVYVDLSSHRETKAQRDSWDLGFYSGDDYRVVLNPSIYMAAKALDFYDIDAVTEADVSAFQSAVAVGTFDPSNLQYIDHPNGALDQTAIAEIPLDSSQSPVYLINMGFEVGTEEAVPGSVAVAGEHRGWRKVQIIRDGEGYQLRYASLEDTSHQTVSIDKNNAYNFTFFSMVAGSEVTVEPEKNKWDLNFTVYTNVITGAGSYGFADFVLHNRKNNVQVYMVEETSIAYATFTSSDVDASQFSLDQTIIGSSWRNVFDDLVYEDRYFIVKDTEDNYYKLQFLNPYTNEEGDRGYPRFTYALLTE